MTPITAITPITVMKFVLCLVLVVASAAPLEAFPQFLQLFQADPFRRPEVDGCGTCHVNPGGGGPRNQFGQAFEANQMRVTPMLRSQFPDRFVYPTSRVDPDNVIHFADPDDRTVVVELGGVRYLVDVAARNVPGLDTSPTQSLAEANTLQGDTPSPVDPATSEGAFFGPRIVNLPNGKGLGARDVEFLIGHRFGEPLFTKNSPGNLLGFDSFAAVTFGVEVGLTDWMSVSAMRSNLDRTIEIASGFQLSTQGANRDGVSASSAPVSTRLRIGVEGRNNFRDRFAPFAQFVASRSFGDRFSLAVVPGIAFNTRDENTFLPPSFLFGADSDYTASIGVGAGLRVLPTVSLVAEYVPRVAGFKGERFDRPAVSIGIQKATFRHMFEFVISTASPLTTAQYTVNGTDTFKVGFNIYRRLR
jgi:hypothetical protein